MQWLWLKFNALSNQQLYDVLQLRETVFTVSQKCDEPDIDGKDSEALHLLGYDGNQLTAYLRVYQKNNTRMLSRIVVNPAAQGKGYGRIMIKETIKHLTTLFPTETIAMSAQAYLEQFYQSLGFITQGEKYLEAGIEHVHMSLKQ